MIDFPLDPGSQYTVSCMAGEGPQLRTMALSPTAKLRRRWWPSTFRSLNRGPFVQSTWTQVHALMEAVAKFVDRFLGMSNWLS